ncbi:MAG: response regulator transcription factor [Candidatus Promineifilaceae bacterium]|nr:response regulator transcription factor [Candidatus Promineifilaceae bacterium]
MKEPYRIFVVDDHHAMRNVLLRLLEKAPGLWPCGAAASAKEALLLIPSVHPDLVLVDISLPDMDGLRLVREIREQWPWMPTLTLSGHDEALYVQAARAAGASGFLSKSNTERLVDVVHAILERGAYFDS